MDTDGTETCLSTVFSISLALVIKDSIYFLEMFSIINTGYKKNIGNTIPEFLCVWSNLSTSFSVCVCVAQCEAYSGRARRSQDPAF